MNMLHQMQFFDDDGNEVNLDLIPKPALCISCKKNDDPDEHFFCAMNRFDQRNDEEFICFAYKKLNEK